ncbi:antibiotic biosynthesis monooxygenase [Nocardioides sp.]|uniref:antibiotic biosynthesis monooxygenase n=1 Tax=Nocardioides sp. TaxID=35761 RepID=UPI003D0BA960
MTSSPVTVSITRHVLPELADEMVRWIRAGEALAEQVPGFLGAGWVRPGLDSDRWQLLYRFADEESLAGWENSERRRSWLWDAEVLGLVESASTRGTGLEGWFDGTPSAPPRWKQASVIWLAFFPLSLIAAYVFAAVAPHLSIPLRVLLTTFVMIPLMTWVVLPQLTRRLGWWLNKG